MAENEARRGCKPDLCESCAFAKCGLRCMKEAGCELDMGRLCKCDLVLPGEDCKYFEEDKSNEHTE